jgi:uncharacterized repeat protein (TIGR03847 family)
MKDRGRTERFVAGALGPPGNRTFLLQFAAGDATESFLLEKGQVAALGEQALELLGRVGFLGAGSSLDPGTLEEPDELVFRVGQIELGYVEDSGLFTIVLHSVEDDEPVAYTVTPALLDAASRDGLEAVRAGRPLCPRCGLAMDADGHRCPKDNGDLRSHRP